MVSVKSFAAAAAAAVVSTAAYAADMPMPPPQMVYQPAPPCCETGRWYLRGDIGVGVQTFSSFDFTQTNSVFVWPSNWQIVQKDIQDTSIFGMGVGYELNNWLRFDVTGEYRTKAMFKATGSYTNFCGGGGVCFDVNTGNYSAAVFMANTYIDLGTWWCITPFIGAGVGGAYNTISGIQDNGIISNGIVGLRLRVGQLRLDSGLERTGRPHLQRQRQSQDRLQLALSEPRLAANRRRRVSEHRKPAPAPSTRCTTVTSQDFRIGLRWLFPAGGGIGLFPVAQAAFAPHRSQYIPAPPPQYVPQPQYAPPPMAPPVYAPQPPISTRG